MIAGIVVWGPFKNSQILGIVSPLSDEPGIGGVQYRVIFDKKTRDHYPPNEYFPTSLEPIFTGIDIETKAYAVMDRGEKKLLAGKHITQELPIASTAKIMTAVVALEKGSLSDELTVSSYTASIGEASMGLTAGEIVRVEDLLYGLMLPSGNDAAEALAEGLGPGRFAFISAMNEKAQSLGLYDTYFFNTTGLDGVTLESTTFSTALDLLALTNYALNNPVFAEIVSSHYHEVPYSEGKHKAFYMENILQLERSYPGIKGVKPGITDFAGETLVSYAENGGKELIIVLLGSHNTRDNVVKLYDYIYDELGISVR